MNFLKLLLKRADVVLSIEETKVFLLDGFLCMLKLLGQLLNLMLHQDRVFLLMDTLLNCFLFLVQVLCLLLSKLGLKAFDFLVESFLSLLIKLYRGKQVLSLNRLWALLLIRALTTLLPEAICAFSQD